MNTTVQKTVLLLGDSLIEYGNWEEALKPYRAINLGIAGETVEGLLERLPHVLKHHQEVQFCVLMSGINNVAMEDYSFLPVYQEILEILKRTLPETKIIVCSLLPVNLDWVDNGTIRGLNKGIAAICTRMGAYFLDLYSAFVDHRGRPELEYLLEDGVHLSKEGYRQWTEALLRTISDIQGQGGGVQEGP